MSTRTTSLPSAVRGVAAACVLTLGVGLACAWAGVASARPTEPERSGETSGSVTLPLEVFDALSARAARRVPPARPAPADALLVSSELKGRVEGDLARGTLRIEGEVLRAGPTRVGLLVGHPTVVAARVAGRTLPLLASGEGLDAVLSGPAPFVLELEWVAPLAPAPGRAILSPPVPRAGSVRATFELPGEPAEVVLGGGSVTRRRTVAGATLIDAVLDAGAAAHLTWSARDAQAPPQVRETRLLGDVKTLVTLGEAELGVTVLLDVTVVEGAPERLVLELPQGFELTDVSGPSLDGSSEESGRLTLLLREPQRRRHQFVLGLTRAVEGASYEVGLPLVRLPEAQRETGELGVVGVGTLELGAREGGSLRRIDPSEAAAALRSLARAPLLAAFRYHRRGDVGPSLVLAVQRFAPAPVLGALAEQARATTLVTREGRALTELRLTVRNQAQPFLRVGLPAGATLLSADVAGESVKPVQGEGGTRVPLLRRGFRPDGPYEVSFVYLQPGAAFGKRGEATLGLPPIDVPVTRLDWELFLPERYEVKRFDGDLRLYGPEWDAGPGISYGVEGHVEGGVPGGVVGGVAGVSGYDATWDASRAPNVTGIVGRVVDERGGAVPGATVTLRDARAQVRTAESDEQGVYTFPGVAQGDQVLRAELAGFAPVERRVRYSGGRLVAHLELRVAGLLEAITVNANAPRGDAWNLRPNEAPQQQAPSSNVFNLQRRVAGLLPVRVEVPRSGVSFHLVRALVLDEPSQVSFRYKAR